jgi:hypothetical protein
VHNRSRWGFDDLDLGFRFGWSRWWLRRFAEAGEQTRQLVDLLGLGLRDRLGL